MSPQRIQRQRVKGWRMPDGAVYVGRPSKWGNPYRVQEVNRFGHYPWAWRVRPEPSVGAYKCTYVTERKAAERAVHLFRQEAGRPSWADRIVELRGRDLACWCPLDMPCHADVLLDLANRDADR